MTQRAIQYMVLDRIKTVAAPSAVPLVSSSIPAAAAPASTVAATPVAVQSSAPARKSVSTPPKPVADAKPVAAAASEKPAADSADTPEKPTAVLLSEITEDELDNPNSVYALVSNDVLEAEKRTLAYQIEGFVKQSQTPPAECICHVAAFSAVLIDFLYLCMYQQ